MKVCVVGGTGNISQPIVELFLKHGHELTVFNRGLRAQVPPDVRLITGDRENREDFESKMQAENFDVAIDMICFNPEDAASDIRAFKNVSHFIQVSTVCTYGIDYDFLPVTEEHPLRPITDYGKNKAAADNVFREAHNQNGFPVTIIKPSTTFGPEMGLLRQIAWDQSWVHRVETERPILILGEGFAPHQFLHVNDAAYCFLHLLGRHKCIGQTYNMVDSGYVTWKQWHQAAMNVIGKEVELVGTTLSQLNTFQVPQREICSEIFAHNCYYSNAKIKRDIPEFQPKLSLEDGIADVYQKLKSTNHLPQSECGGWEDSMIKKIKALH